MALASAKIVVIDSSTLGDVSRDYWSMDLRAQAKARDFVSEMFEKGAFIAFTFTHLSELLRHKSAVVVQGRLKFLQTLPLIAWLRPYDRHWFPGPEVCLYARELHAFHYSETKRWKETIEAVRPDLWETGNGSEMFVDDKKLWTVIRAVSMQQLEDAKYISSLARTRVGDVSKLTREQCRRISQRPRIEWPAFFKEFAAEVKSQLDQRGDPRLEKTGQIATHFARDTWSRVDNLLSKNEDLFEAIIQHHGIPEQLVGPKTTVDELGELAVYANQLQIFQKQLVPPCSLNMLDVPPGSLPGYSLQRRIASLQETAFRVDGSDLGDSHLASLVFYADAVQVDKRTFDYLRRIVGKDRSLTSLICPFFKTHDYSLIPKRIGC